MAIAPKKKDSAITTSTAKRPMGKSPNGGRREKVLTVLAKARAMEMFAITQYMLQHYTLDDLDYGALASKVKRIAIDEMRHAEMFAERIKELDGQVTAERDNSTILQKEQTVEAIFPFDSILEDDTIEIYNGFIQICRDSGDNISARLFEDITKEEQEHQNYFDDVTAHIKKLGNSYLAKMAEGAAD